MTDIEILEKAEQIRKSKKNKKKGKFMKGIIVGIFLFLFVFTGIILWLFYKTGSEPSTLIGSVFGACLGEFGFLSLIKNKKGSNQNE